jgi:hypothetical protein
MNNTQSGLKRIIRLVLAVAVIFLVVRWCSGSFGSVIPLPGGSGGSGGSGGESTEDSGGWFSPKKQNDRSTVNEDLIEDVEDLERELGIGSNKGRSTTNNNTINIPSSTPSASGPLTFKGIPMTGSLSAFGSELVKAGFRNAGNGTYTGEFAGYSGCKVTPSGSNPVQEVRIDFPVISDWNALEQAYDSLQASLTQKYGIEPVVNRNLAVYNLPNGTISLDADVSNQASWHVILKYTNALTTASTGTLGRNPIDDL